MHWNRRRKAMLGLIAATPLVLANTAGPLDPKPASPATIAAQRAAAQVLPADDGRDGEFAARGFIATLADPVIKDAKGRPVWNLAAYDWVDGPAPASVNPSLWRLMRHLKRHGLFKVADGVWQVRGFDLANMTVVQGQTGWILIDPLTARETAAAALALVNRELGARPVSAVIYSHSHADHYGGVRGVVEQADVAAGKVAVIAPEHFVAEAASENVMAGSAMSRRAQYQFGAGLSPGPQGQMGSGIGMAVAPGEITLIQPTDTITRSGETRVVDGVPLEFQIVSGSEAPSELNVLIQPSRVFLSAEISTCTMHNILTPRGAKVRDAHAWAGFLDEAATRFAPRADVVVSSHCWPTFGRDAGVAMLAGQRDNYRYLHDQTVRLMNRGETMVEIAEQVTQPPALARQWDNHGYYGTFNHNAKAIYQYYLGWYDAVPANLNPHPPVERARRTIALMGGANKAIAAARKAMKAGDYRWSSDLLSQVVFADAANQTARALLADSYEQQGYQAESAIWRNQFLAAARELRAGKMVNFSNQSADMIGAIPTRLLLDSAATRFDPAKLGGRQLAINLVMPDRRETAGVELTGVTMLPRMEAHPAPAATLTGPRQMMLALLFMKVPLAQLEQLGLKVSGDRAAVEAWLNSIDPVGATFNIAEP